MEDSYFEKIPVWGRSDYDFEILADEFSGRIPVTRLEHWKDLTDLLDSPFFNRAGANYIYRGHRRWDWGLAPTLARVSSNNLVSEELAQRQLDHFRRATRGRIQDTAIVNDDETHELWSVGQHHGLKTPLLDWTYSPYVALFFAFAKKNASAEEDNPYRAIYVLNKTFIDDKRHKTVEVIEPKKDHYGRLVNQAGLFTLAPYNSTIEGTITDVLGSEDFADDELRSAGRIEDAEGERNDEEPGVIAKYICKIYIRNDGREDCIKHLRRMNVHHASLFPDLLGAAEHCNLVVAEEHKEYEIQSYAKEQTDRLERTDKEEILPVTLQIDSTVHSTSVGEVTLTPGISKLTREDVVAALKEGQVGLSVEPGRLEAIAAKLVQELGKYKVIDWSERESAQAKIRNFIRVVLREYGYPSSTRYEVVDKLFTIMLLREVGEIK